MNNVDMSDEVKMQEPGQLIRPTALDENTVRDTVSRLYGLCVTSYRELPSYDDRNYHVQVKETGTGKIETASPDGYVLKVLNTVDSKKSRYVEGMTCLLLHLNKFNVRVSKPQPNKDGGYYSLEIFRHSTGEEKCVVRLFDYIPGQILASVPYEPRLLYNIGKFVGKMDSVLMKFHHPFYDIHRTIWSLTYVPQLVDQAHFVKDDNDRQMVLDVIKAFTTEVVPVYDKLQQSIIHGDANEQNILVSLVKNQYDITAIIDAGDATKCYLVFEVGILIAYAMIDNTMFDVLDSGGHVLAGYLTHLSLNSTERDILRVVAASRLVQSLVMGLTAYNTDPGNEYLLTTSHRGWPCLRKLWACSKEDLYARWDRIIQEYDNNQ